MVKIDVYSAKGTKLSKSATLPKKYEEKPNPALLAQAIHVYQDRSHPGLAKVKTRGEVSLTTRKWYRQKGTGRARHGAKSAPIFVGGGVAHGPKGVKRTLTMPKKMRQKAFKIALTQKAKDKQLVLVEGVSDWKKTAQAQDFVKKLIKSQKLKTGAKLTFGLSDETKEVYRTLRNLKNVQTKLFRNLNARNIFLGGFIVLDKEALSK